MVQLAQPLHVGRLTKLYRQMGFWKTSNAELQTDHNINLLERERKKTTTVDISVSFLDSSSRTATVQTP